jgi:hypothetical protein
MIPLIKWKQSLTSEQGIIHCQRPKKGRRNVKEIQETESNTPRNTCIARAEAIRPYWRDGFRL